MELHKDTNVFGDALGKCHLYCKEQGLQLSRTVIEKDYWVSYMLSKFAETDYSNKIVFGGGTALMKAHHLTGRFSEDLDFCALNNGMSSTQKQKDCFNAFDTLRKIAENTKELSIDVAQYKKTKAHCIMGLSYDKTGIKFPYLKSNIEVEVLITPQRYTSDKMELKPIYSIIARYLHKVDRDFN
jgi:predicted nucleotidyltransferase component of viral defense system